jgi:hypothetical protein
MGRERRRDLTDTPDAVLFSVEKDAGSHMGDRKAGDRMGS